MYDTPARSLRQRGQVLRLRNYGDVCTVTHKRQPEASVADAMYKTRIETESRVEDCEAMVEIFAQLGYTPVFTYDKYRTEWIGEGGNLVLDETPIGIWAELEGAPQWIDEMLVRLGVSPLDTTILRCV